ncbi:MAG TPA: hypothetical protein VGL53_06245 [Bryobacteraceae bacterium]|jgi:hypothetical protein
MITRSVCSLIATSACVLFAQTPAVPVQPTAGAPIYRVTVVERTTKAINYRYRSDPTMIDFAGTVLMPTAKGSAIVTSKQGRTEIDANFQHLTSPGALGPELLTYVLWALTPDGRPHNLGEVIANSRDHAGLRVSTDLQAFALIVTAEPYSAVRAPSDVVVMENKVRPDTEGLIEQVNARYELLPRGHYTLDLSSGARPQPPDLGRVSTREYEVLLELYQAQNAINIARSARADAYAGDQLARAEGLLNSATDRHNRKGDRTLILQEAREATEAAEDARLVAEERVRKQESARLAAEAAHHREAQARAEAEAARARADRQAVEEQLQRTEAAMQANQQKANAQLQVERAARVRAEADVSALQQQRTSEAQVKASDLALKQRQADQRAFRARVFESLNATLPVIDTPRGLVVRLGDSSFTGMQIHPDVSQRARRLAATLASYRGLTVGVEGYCDNPALEQEATARAEEVAALLRAEGIQAFAQFKGNQHPVGPAPIDNRRIEIVVTGESLGDSATWDRPYSVTLPPSTEAHQR